MKILFRNNESDEWEPASAVETQGEAELQSLLIESPSLIPVEEIRENTEELVLAVSEFGLPGSGRTDVLAFSEKGDIVIVECKLAANPEAKRKVIGQILEYGAYLWQMDYEALDARIREREGESLVDLMELAAADEWDQTEFRTRIEKTLESGAFLLIVVVDEVNPELRRIIRYVNDCSKSVFSIHALELRRFESGGLQVLVPKLFGLSPGPADTLPETWTEDEFFRRLGLSVEAQVVDATQALYEWTQGNADNVYHATGQDRWSFTFHYRAAGLTVSVFTVYTDGQFVLNYEYLINRVEEEILDQFHTRVTQIAAFSAMPADFSKRHRVELARVVESRDEVTKLKEVVVWFGRMVAEAV